MKENLEFYQHFSEADQHPKFKMLRVKYGWAGEGKFWALNNRIALAKRGQLNISKKYNKATFATDLDFNLEEFDEFIIYLHEECELILFDTESGCITTETIQENLEKVMKDREGARTRKQKKKPPQNTDSSETKKSSPELPESSPDQNNKPNQTKPNKTKLKETKVYNLELQVIFKEISTAIIRIDGLSKNNKNKNFNPRKWAVDQFRSRGHPGAILESLTGIHDCWDAVEKPYGYVNSIMKTKNGNYNEADEIKMYAEMKKIEPNELSKITHGLFDKL